MKFRELYLDTTYIMPFFYLDIDVKGFSRTVYKEVIKSVERIQGYCSSKILMLRPLDLSIS